MANGTFVTVINCMDGRVQQPAINWMKQTYAVDYVDMITEAGADKYVAQGAPDQLETIKEKVNISINKHGSKVVAIVGHDDCAGNPVSKEIHLNHIAKSVEIIQSWGFNAEVVGLWIDENWKVSRI